jgi:hypothetical protein
MQNHAGHKIQTKMHETKFIRGYLVSHIINNLTMSPTSTNKTNAWPLKHMEHKHRFPIARLSHKFSSTNLTQTHAHTSAKIVKSLENWGAKQPSFSR